MVAIIAGRIKEKDHSTRVSFFVIFTRLKGN